PLCDVRVGDSQDNLDGHLTKMGFPFPATDVVSTAVRIDGHDEQIGPGFLRCLDVPHELREFGDRSAMAAPDAVRPDGNVDFLIARDALYQRSNDLLMAEILDEEDDPTHRSPLGRSAR